MLIPTVRPWTMVTIVAVCLATGHTVHTRNSSRFVTKRMLHLGIQGVMVVLAVILLASVAEEVLVAKLLIADTSLEALLLKCGGLSHWTVDSLATAVHGNASRVTRSRPICLSDTGAGRRYRFRTLWRSDRYWNGGLLYRRYYVGVRTTLRSIGLLRHDRLWFEDIFETGDWQ